MDVVADVEDVDADAVDGGAASQPHVHVHRARASASRAAATRTEQRRMALWFLAGKMSGGRPALSVRLRPLR